MGEVGIIDNELAEVEAEFFFAAMGVLLLTRWVVDKIAC